MIVSPAFAGKRYAVLGLARSGQAAVATLVSSGAHVMAWDSRDEPRQALCEWIDCGKVELADPVTADLSGYEAIVVSPGIPLNRHPVSDAAARAGVPVIGDIELFALARDSLPEHRVVGITGTNGKSTTTSLVHHILTVAGVPARVGGNIGVPVLGADPLPKGGVYVLELSSYQIDLTFSLDCDVAALLNITPDHLERYGDFQTYAASKARLFEMQGKEHRGVFGTGDRETRSIARIEAARREAGLVRLVDGSQLVEMQRDWPSLQGPHNLQNAAVAVAIVEALGITKAQWKKALRNFRGLPHRMERVAEAGGVVYINDSKATNPASAAPAIAAFPPDPEPRIHWIVGGLPKGDDLDECAPYFGNIAAAYTIGDAGPRFAEILSPHTRVFRSEMMAEAIRQAMAAAKPGDIVMLSPACASFDQFRDFEARGQAFRQIVEALLAPDEEEEVKA
ncbi:UDP-N-acetylmuramoyl-L-alanine--D-glutamate ligase [Novosphingobium malaysiense]|uniref:UDP-N-acetylmuramoylalanine--D-glutamate ligase n=1 Tax=Novosphingobium malaysiense TaxID=1348853 RepID=A0A0B1ZN02_9SPHN|nr:UDP-N-acetylmuramoyl-L-alanine--D-glutamate ligase [Novosphingobium malaysiense]KHK90606.1 UDP-N-acetylmuramoylalanine--D-glutamate ligase [Novosphingobium malaysiense]